MALQDRSPGDTVLEFIVEETERRDRLDKLVVRRLESVGQPTSRATVQRWIDEDRVLVDGHPARASASVRAGAHLEVRPAAPPPSTAIPQPEITLRIVYEDDALLVVDKPAGMVVHPARGHASGTLVNALLGRGMLDRAQADARDPMGLLRPGIVHRLDKGTSGLIVVAKDAPAREALKAAFQRHDIDREYIAVVVGAARDATYETLHGRHPKDRMRFSSFVAEGRRAVTYVRVIERLGPATVVGCRLDTGRTHQIRVHLAERSKTPILADPLYGTKPRDALLQELATELGHQALHARVLGFAHPRTGRAMRWESPLPADVDRVIARLRSAPATKSST